MTDKLDYEALAKKVEATDKQLAAFYRSMLDDAPDKPANRTEKLKREFIIELYIARRKQHVSQTELAGRVGIPQSSLARIESGRANPTLTTVLKIAQALEVRLRLQPEA